MHRDHKSLGLLLVVGVAIGSVAQCMAQQEEFSNWLEGASPQAIGKRVAENFIVRAYRAQSDPSKASIGIIYPEVCTWYGALTLAQHNGGAGAGFPRNGRREIHRSCGTRNGSLPR